MKKVSETRQKMNRVQFFRDHLAAKKNLDEVYALLNQLSSDVFDLYPHIACRTQCSTCCKGYSMPAVTALEWEQVFLYLHSEYSEEDRQKMLQRARDMYNPRKDKYWAVHDVIQQPHNQEQLQRFAEVLPQLHDTQCVFLVDESCSVYSNRPAKCRAHGAFLHVLGQEVLLHACESEVEKMDAHLADLGSRKVLMPVWNDFDIKLRTEINPPEAPSTILMLWLVTHLQEGRLIESVNLNPDFEAFRLQDI